MRVSDARISGTAHANFTKFSAPVALAVLLIIMNSGSRGNSCLQTSHMHKCSAANASRVTLTADV